MAAQSNGTKPAAARPYFRLDTSWWLVQTAGMNAYQVAAFDRLMVFAWMQDPPGTLPDDEQQLAAMAGVSLDKWSDIGALVTSRMTRVPRSRPARLGIPFLIQQYEAMCTEHAANVAAGRAGARKRWHPKGGGK